MLAGMRDRAILYILSAILVTFGALAYSYMLIAAAGRTDTLEFIGICYMSHYPETATLFYAAMGAGLVFLSMAAADVWRRGRDWHWLASGMAAVIISFIALLIIPYYVRGVVHDAHDGFATTMFVVELLVLTALAWILHRDRWMWFWFCLIAVGMVLSGLSLLDLFKLMFTGQILVQLAFCFALIRGIVLLEKVESGRTAGKKKRRLR